MSERRISRKQLIRVGAALSLGSIGASVLASCGGGGSSTSSDEGSAASSDMAGAEEGLSGPEIESGQAIAAEGEVPPNSAVPFTNAETGQPEVLVRLQDGEFVAYSAVCTHQQCTVAYQPQSQRLACPCHGGVYDPASNAAVEAGPPPRPLPEAGIEVRDGQVFKA